MAQVNSQYTLDFILDLRHAYPPLSGKAAVNFGSAKGDNGGGSFYWDESSVTADDGATVIKPYIVISAGRWIKEPDNSGSITVESTDLSVTAGSTPDAVNLALKDVATPGTGTKATIDSKGRVTAVASAALDEIADVSLSTPAANDALVYNGTAWVNSPALNQTFATSNPTSGTYTVGTIIWNSAPTAGGPLGWVCTVAGTPGTWNTFGIVGDAVAPPPAPFTLTIVSPTANQTLSGNATFTVQAPSMLNVELFDAAGNMLKRLTPDANGFATGDFTTIGMQNGTQTLTATAWDAAAGAAFTNSDTKTVSVVVSNGGTVGGTLTTPTPINGLNYRLIKDWTFGSNRTEATIHSVDEFLQEFFDGIWYAPSTPSANVSMQTDALRLTLTNSGGSISEPTFASKWSGKFGYFEIMSKCQNVTGAWPGFWLYPNNTDARNGTNGGEAFRDEIDIYEIFNNGGTPPGGGAFDSFWTSDRAVFSVHEDAVANTNGHTLTDQSSTTVDTTAYQKYGCLWTSDGTLKWYVNDVLIKTSSINWKDAAPNVLIDTWSAGGGNVSGGFGGSTISSGASVNHDISYIRVYQI